jgi:hypothetical protein
MTMNGGHRGHDVQATYDSMEDARSALVALERRGVDAAEIELVGEGARASREPRTNDEMLDADLTMERHLERRGGAGLVVGLLIGVLFGASAGWLLGGGNAAALALGGAAGGAIFGAGLGFLWGAFSGMAVDQGWADTYAATADPARPVMVVVHADSDYESVVETLRRTNPASLRVA